MSKKILIHSVHRQSYDDAMQDPDYYSVSCTCGKQYKSNDAIHRHIMNEMNKLIKSVIDKHHFEDLDFDTFTVTCSCGWKGKSPFTTAGYEMSWHQQDEIEKVLKQK